TLLELCGRETAQEAAAGRVAVEVQAVQLHVADADATLNTWRDTVAGLEMRLTQAATSIELLAQRARFLEEQRERVQADLAQLQGEKTRDAKALTEWTIRIDSSSRELSAKAESVAREESALSEAVQRYRQSQAALEAGRARVMDRTMAATVITNQVTNSQTRGWELTRRIEKLEQERIQAGVTLDVQQQQLGACRERRRQNETALQETVAAVGRLSGTMTDLKKRLSDADQRLSTVQEELTVCLARQRALHAITRQPLPPSGASESLGVTLAHFLTVRSEYDCAIEAVLGHKLMGTLVESPQEAARSLKTLDGQSAGGRTFLPKHPRSGPGAPSRIHGEGVVGCASDIVSPSPGYETLMSHLLA